MLILMCMVERKKKKDYDFNVTAFNIVQQATGESEEPQEKPSPTEGKNPHAVALGRLGGLKGGKVRAAKLTSAQRSEIARKAALKRWRGE